MSSPLENILEAALSGAVRGTAREIGQQVHSGLARANAVLNRARVPLKIAQAGLDAAEANLTSLSEFAAAALRDDAPRNVPRR